MGLDTTHGCWNGSYGRFAVWRSEIARAAGYPVLPSGSYELDWDAFKDENYDGEWDHDLGDPLLYLLVHSDCEGVIHPKQGALLVTRLSQLLPALEDWARSHTEQFIAGLQDASAASEDVMFG